MSVASTSYVQVYQGPTSKITFTKNEKKELNATIETKRLTLQPVTMEHVERYQEIYSKDVVMAKFLDGKTKTADYVKGRITTLETRWKNNDPYGGFEVCEKTKNTILGLAFIGHGDQPGVSVIAGLGDDSYWQQGYGSEAATAVVREYSLATFQENYQLDGQLLKSITGTARKDNEGSWKIMEKALGMKRLEPIANSDPDRYEYSIDLADIKDLIKKV